MRFLSAGSLPPALGAAALPRRVPVVAAGVGAEQLGLGHADPPLPVAPHAPVRTRSQAPPERDLTRSHKSPWSKCLTQKTRHEEGVIAGIVLTTNRFDQGSRGYSDITGPAAAPPG